MIAKLLQMSRTSIKDFRRGSKVVQSLRWYRLTHRNELTTLKKALADKTAKLVDARRLITELATTHSENGGTEAMHTYDTTFLGEALVKAVQLELGDVEVHCRRLPSLGVGQIVIHPLEENPVFMRYFTGQRGRERAREPSLEVKVEKQEDDDDGATIRVSARSRQRRTDQGLS